MLLKLFIPRLKPWAMLKNAICQKPIANGFNRWYFKSAICRTWSKKVIYLWKYCCIFV